MKGAPVLQVIQDIGGVVGSFATDATGDVLLQLLPPKLSQAALQRAAARVASVARCAAICELDVQRCDFRFDRHQLFVWHFREGVLGVLADASVSQRALEMAVQLTIPLLRALTHATALRPQSGRDQERARTRRSSDAR
jgi:hypothetical protein